MLQKPDIDEAALIACLHNTYALNIPAVKFLPLGADRDTAVYRAGDGSTDYFVKLRSDFDAMSILVPALLHDQGVRHIIAPLRTTFGELWTAFEDFTLTVFPYIEGKNAADTSMTDQHMTDFGQTLKQMHSAVVPPEIQGRIQREDYTDRWRERVRQWQREIASIYYTDPISAALISLLNNNKSTVDALVNGTAHLAKVLAQNPRPYVLCHADIHVWNVLITDDGRFYIVDWDTTILAPKERDLMFIGSGLGGKWHTPQEMALFYKGYGETEVDPYVIAYYRMERIVQDIAEYCTTILTTTQGDDRAEGLQQITSQFALGSIVDIALESTEILPPSYRPTSTKFIVTSLPR